MPVLQFWKNEIYVENPHVCLIILTRMSQIYKRWSLHDSNSTITGTCIIQNQRNWRSHQLNHKHNHRYRQALSFQIYYRLNYVLKPITNVAAVVCFDPLLVFLKFSFLCQNNLYWLLL